MEKCVLSVFFLFFFKSIRKKTKTFELRNLETILRGIGSIKQLANLHSAISVFITDNNHKNLTKKQTNRRVITNSLN